jgi:hypothetical protein
VGSELGVPLTQGLVVLVMVVVVVVVVANYH